MGKIFMVLLVALGAAMAIPSTRAKLVDAGTPVMDRVKTKLVPRRLEVMADQLDVRLERGQGLPASWDGWLRRDFSGAPEDPWGNLYYIDAGRRGGFTVGSMGPDGVQGTEDDITVQRSPGR